MFTNWKEIFLLVSGPSDGSIGRIKPSSNIEEPVFEDTNASEKSESAFECDTGDVKQLLVTVRPVGNSRAQRYRL